VIPPDLAGFFPPQGKQDDIGFHTGEVLAWDQVAGTNTIRVLGVPMDDLQVVSTGSVMVGVGDTVAIWRYKSTYFIMGRIAPVDQALAVRAAVEPATSYTTSTATFSDLNTTVGPTLTDVYIGPSRQCLVFLSCGATATDEGYASAHFQVTGASTINPPTGGGNWSEGAFIGNDVAGVGANTAQVAGSATRIFYLTAANGLNSGLNTFTVKYMGVDKDGGPTTNNDCFFFHRVIIVFPL
jgi:hypothetical protein